MLKQPHMTYRPFDSIPLAAGYGPKPPLGGVLWQGMRVPLGAIAVLAVTVLT